MRPSGSKRASSSAPCAALSRNDIIILRHEVLALFIHGVNKSVLFGSGPLLKLLFPGYGLLNIRERLKVHQLMAIVLLRKARDCSRPVFCHTPFQIVCHTDVQCCVAFVREDVCVVLVVHDCKFLDFSALLEMTKRGAFPLKRLPVAFRNDREEGELGEIQLGEIPPKFPLISHF